MKVLSFTDDEESMQSILSEVKDLDKQLKRADIELDKAKIKAQRENQSINFETIRKGISSLKGDSFRKKSLSTKKAIIQSVIKSIHINPDNVIRIDVWGGKNRPERPERSQPTQSGVALPFYKKAKKFVFEDVKKGLSLWTPVRVAACLVEQRRGHAHRLSSDIGNLPSISIFIDHYFSLPVHNEELLRKLYLEMDLSTYKISEITDWSKTSIADALRSLEIIKENRKGPKIKPQKTTKKTKRVVNKKEK